MYICMYIHTYVCTNIPVYQLGVDILQDQSNDGQVQKLAEATSNFDMFISV